MRQQVMEPHQQGLLGGFFDTLYNLPPGVIALIAVVLVLAGIWQGYRALPFHRALQALKQAPVQSDVPPPSDQTGLHRESPYRALVRAQRRFWLRAGAAYLCVLLGVWTLKTHLEMYPSASAFIQALAERPFQGAASLRPVSAP